jgi:hypothetical protein
MMTETIHDKLEAAEEKLAIAKTILAQLGGGRFTAMTGAKNLMAHADGLSFRLPSRFAKDGINYVKVTLTPMDTYTVEFGKVWGRQYRVIADRDDVYAEDLQRVFTDATGLDTNMGGISP